MVPQPRSVAEKRDSWHTLLPEEVARRIQTDVDSEAEGR